MRTFLEVQKTRHFGRAAENLYLTQSAVSFRIRQLEELLGVKLFERYRHNIQLTPAGERLVSHAQAILTAWQRATQEVGLHERQRLQLVLGAPSNLWDAVLQEHLVSIARQLPDVALSTDTLNSHALVRSLLEHTLDLAVLLDPPKVEELSTDSLGWLDLVMVSSRELQTPAQLDETDFVLINWGTAFSIRQAKAVSHTLNPVLQTSQTSIALEYLLRDNGAAFMPLRVVAPLLDEGQLHRVPGIAQVRRELFAVYRNNNGKQQAIAELVNTMRTHTANGQSGGTPLQPE
nr:LysR substrate-binding domain-containing protein [Motiliproteus sediminis]